MWLARERAFLALSRERPLLILFEISIWLSAYMERRWERAAEASSEA